MVNFFILNVSNRKLYMVSYNNFVILGIVFFDGFLNYLLNLFIFKIYVYLCL